MLLQLYTDTYMYMYMYMYVFGLADENFHFQIFQKCVLVITFYCHVTLLRLSQLSSGVDSLAYPTPGVLYVLFSSVSNIIGKQFHCGQLFPHKYKKTCCQGVQQLPNVPQTQILTIIKSRGQTEQNIKVIQFFSLK